MAGERFDDIYGAHFAPLTVQLYAFTGDLGEAQDVVQEAFTRAWQRWDRLSEYEDPVAWIRRVAWNVATSRWRRIRTAVRFASRQPIEYVDGPGPERVALLRALRSIPANQRRAVVLHHLADLSVAEIAQQCGASEGTVRSWLHRGRTALASELATAR